VKYLLDTHTFLWWDMQSARLSARVRDLLQDKSNVLRLSVASVWEMQIKLQLGKLKPSAPLAEIIKKQREANGIELLPIEVAHILGLSSLPSHHKDPFDRLLIAQANVEGFTLITDDPFIAQYPVKVVW
jgi:PIN domain nuclease of toxin-antitoxin system